MARTRTSLSLADLIPRDPTLHDLRQWDLVLLVPWVVAGAFPLLPSVMMDQAGRCITIDMEDRRLPTEVLTEDLRRMVEGVGLEIDTVGHLEAVRVEIDTVDLLQVVTGIVDIGHHLPITIATIARDTAVAVLSTDKAASGIEIPQIVWLL